MTPDQVAAALALISTPEWTDQPEVGGRSANGIAWVSQECWRSGSRSGLRMLPDLTDAATGGVLFTRLGKGWSVVPSKTGGDVAVYPSPQPRWPVLERVYTGATLAEAAARALVEEGKHGG